MKVYTTILIVLISVFSVVLAMEPQDDEVEVEHICGPYEVYNFCGPPEGGCVRTCANRFEDIGCADVCIPGCYCDFGYIRRTYKGPCIPETDCPKPCHDKAD